jgi:hypothetical protein
MELCKDRTLLSASYGAIFPCIVMNCCINSIHSYALIIVCYLFLPLHDDGDTVLIMVILFYFFTKLQITKLVSGKLYFGYMLLASFAFCVLTGAIGFCACFWFTRLIYSSVKID